MTNTFGQGLLWIALSSLLAVSLFWIWDRQRGRALINVALHICVAGMAIWLLSHSLSRIATAWGELHDVLELAEREFLRPAVGSLHVCSFLIAARALLRQANLVLTEILGWRGRRWLRDPRYRSFPKPAALDTRLQRDTRSIAQNGFYLLALVCLWLSLAAPADGSGERPWQLVNWFRAALNFMVFFVVDDWSLISTQIDALEGHTLTALGRRMGVTNAIIFALMPPTAVAGLGSWEVGACVLLLALLLLGCRYFNKYIA